jgi:hypothetical protein
MIQTQQMLLHLFVFPEINLTLVGLSQHLNTGFILIFVIDQIQNVRV